MPSTGNNRRVGHATESCSRCRLNKIRCNPGNGNNGENAAFRLPCKSCFDRGQNCTWGSRVDGRRANAKRALIAENASLKDELHRQKLQYEDLVRHYNNSPPTTTIHSIEVDQLSTMLQCRLVLDPSGLHRYGAPSTFDLRPSTTEYPVLALSDATPLSPMPSNNVIGGPVPWYRFLPMELVPLSELEHLELLDLFFSSFAFWGLRCQQDLFHKDMQEGLSTTQRKRNHWSPMLHNAILAVATGYSENSRLKDLDARMAFAKKAEEYMGEEIRDPTLSGIQAMSHLATFYTGIGDWIAGASFFGMCASMTQTLGLGVDASEFVKANIITEQEKHDRDWLFLAIFLHDKLKALSLGGDILIPKPRSFRIPELKPWLNMDLFREQVNLFSIAGDVFNDLYRRTSMTRNDMKVLFGAAESWVKNLPDSLRMSDQVTFPISREKVLLHLAFHWIVLLAHLPFYRTPSTAFPCIDWREKVLTSCDLAADQIVHLFGIYDNVRQIPLMGIQVAFSAGVVFLFQIERLATNSSQQQEAFNKFVKCLSFLDQMTLTWDCAAKTRKILEDLYGQSPAASSRLCFLATSSRIPFLGQTYEYFSHSPALDLLSGPTHALNIPSISSGSNTTPSEGLIPRFDSLFDVSMGAKFQWF